MTSARANREIVLQVATIVEEAQRYIIQTKFSDKGGGKQCAGKCGRSIVPLVGFVGVTRSVTDWEHRSTHPRSLVVRMLILHLDLMQSQTQ